MMTRFFNKSKLTSEFEFDSSESLDVNILAKDFFCDIRHLF